MNKPSDRFSVPLALIGWLFVVGQVASLIMSRPVALLICAGVSLVCFVGALALRLRYERRVHQYLRNTCAGLFLAVVVLLAVSCAGCGGGSETVGEKYQRIADEENERGLYYEREAKSSWGRGLMTELNVKLAARHYNTSQMIREILNDDSAASYPRVTETEIAKRVGAYNAWFCYASEWDGEHSVLVEGK